MKKKLLLMCNIMVCVVSKISNLVFIFYVLIMIKINRLFRK